MVVLFCADCFLHKNSERTDHFLIASTLYGFVPWKYSDDDAVEEDEADENLAKNAEEIAQIYAELTKKGYKYCEYPRNLGFLKTFPKFFAVISRVHAL